MENKSKKEIMFNRMKNKKKEVKLVRRIVLVIALFIILVGAIGGYIGYNYVKGALSPMDPDSTEKVTVEIPIGSGIDSISSTLEKNGIIKDARIFKYYVKFNNQSDFQAGTYDLSKDMTLDEIIESLKTGKIYREPLFSLTIPEGLTLEQIGEVIEKKTGNSSKEFFELVTSDEFVERMMAKYPALLTEEIKGENVRYALEGYLYPSTYPFFEEKPTNEEIAEMLLAQTDRTMAPYYELLQAEEKSVHWLLTFASLLEEEATAQTDRQKISSVFYNRLEIDMPLQTDPTVLYALGSHKERVLYEDLEYENPYNTYTNKGLPPGPIANAGKSSIEAALDPEDTEYFYFLADKEGKNYFSVTYEEHLQKIDEHLK
ncbi:endolytic transglycosylase MltG [Psychrobacillus sp. FSL K6-2684]|uniref:Endolytic murein transglycosylase n=1 Tax=Psychrobacillus faecigallinarum TaxID=2762235 RepID=A0ABR8R7Q6_9BACI|nr:MULTISPECIES: endolytic transglycosylase MltG [Psychrobacillus]MBD7943791.1 endolytic transglycosylase MltG [Psychrobacillus faecigallinarum]QEY19305.1 endolytic transglycosylase MltG [Psychrobacillus sp. AK 1817]